jgi:RNA polymerase sigma factor (sigma-70 family)
MRQRQTQADHAFSQFLAGDEAAFLMLYEYYNPRFGIYCVKRYRLSFLEAEDILQSVWEKILKLRKKGKLAEIGNFGAFFFRTLTNVAVDLLRRRRDTLSIEEHALDLYAEPETASSPFSRMNVYVMQAFDSLSDDYREVLILQLYCGYELSEIAELQQKSRDAIWARASRARNELRKRVSELAERKQIPLSEFKVLVS